MSSLALMDWFTTVLAAMLVVGGVTTAIRGKVPRRSDLPSRLVRYGAAAFALFGASILLHSVPNLVGLHSRTADLILAAVSLFAFMLPALGLFICTVVVGTRAHSVRVVAQNERVGGRQVRQMH